MMNWKSMVCGVMLGGVYVSANPMDASAQDASWGCQVLLCATSSTPSWRSIPYCVPPMSKLIFAMKRPGFSWPICPDAKSGRPGFERFEPCPAGWSASENGDRYDGLKTYQNNICERDLGRCNSKEARQNSRQSMPGVVTRENETGDGYNSCYLEQGQARKLRDKPYYFDIVNSHQTKERYWFELDL